jgi:hypothetical protein
MPRSAISSWNAGPRFFTADGLISFAIESSDGPSAWVQLPEGVGGALAGL